MELLKQHCRHSSGQRKEWIQKKSIQKFMMKHLKYKSFQFQFHWNIKNRKKLLFFFHLRLPTAEQKKYVSIWNITRSMAATYPHIQWIKTNFNFRSVVCDSIFVSSRLVSSPGAQKSLVQFKYSSIFLYIANKFSAQYTAIILCLHAFLCVCLFGNKYISDVKVALS